MKTMILMLAAAAIAWPQCSAEIPLVVDNFTSGNTYYRTIETPDESDVGFQSGSMAGGYRRTVFFVSTNPLNEPGTVDLRRTPAIIRMGPKVNWGAEFFYGLEAEGVFVPMNLDLTGCNHFRVTADSTDLGFQLLIFVYTTELTRLATVQVFVPPSPTLIDSTVVVDIPFTSFSGKEAIDWRDIDFIAVNLRSGGPVAGDDISLSSIAVVSISD